MKYFTFLSAQTTPKHSSLASEYLDSAEVVYLDEHMTRTQPPMQHTGVSSTQSHFFLSRQNPNPFFDQSVTIQITNPVLNVLLHVLLCLLFMFCCSQRCHWAPASMLTYYLGWVGASLAPLSPYLKNPSLPVWLAKTMILSRNVLWTREHQNWFQNLLTWLHNSFA